MERRSRKQDDDDRISVELAGAFPPAFFEPLKELLHGTSPELMGSLKLDNVWDFVQLIHRPTRA